MENNNTFLSETNNGTVFSVKLVPNSSVNKIVDYTTEYVRIKIAAPAVENKANKELISFCSDILGVNKSKIFIISGEKSKLKKILIKDTKLDELSQKVMFMLNSVQKTN